MKGALMPTKTNLKESMDLSKQQASDGMKKKTVTFEELKEKLTPEDLSTIMFYTWREIADKEGGSQNIKSDVLALRKRIHDEMLTDNTDRKYDFLCRIDGHLRTIQKMVNIVDQEE